ncbi:MAG: site-specific DNA-methyltransferase [Candidatus Competibacter sp.]|nr:site-specific DNA-methyltransferase [Candidatus Competibacter sp.]MDG4585204.1 site-specific DNA-methyltransferase [Candidatus Competibacter sp.]
MTKNQKLELTWIGKENRPKLEPRILLEDPARSYHAAHQVTDGDVFDNRLIFGDNLLALKALEAEFTGKIKCIYIDPPFNTGGAFEHYDDNLEHSIWLSLLRDRLEILQRLLSPDGAIVVNLDDTEAAYCKVLMDQVFGRQNYVTTVVVEAATPSSFKTVNVGPTQTAQFLLFFAKDKTRFKYLQQYIPIYEIDLQHFSRFIENIEEPASQWRFQNINDYVLTQMGFKGDTSNAKWAMAKKTLGSSRAQEEVKQRAIEFVLENSHRVFETKTLQKPSRWLHDHIKRSLDKEKVIELVRDNMESIYLYRGRQVYFLGKAVKEVDGERVVSQPISNIWTDIPTNNLKGEGGVDFPAGKKPETLIRRIIQMISDKPGDLVLDSFAGSGTTGAVAHKMGRRWIMVELGEHCHTHIIPRLKKVIDGEDPSGITKAVGWKGGGGFRYYRLAPSLLEQDKWGNWVINKDYNAAMLAEALCKLEGFRYAPSDAVYWQHGHSTERDFLYVTTAALNHEQLQQLSDEVGPERTLLVLCPAFRGCGEYPNLTVKKIPKQVLNRCEWGHDDYSLRVENLPKAPHSSPLPEGEGARKGCTSLAAKGESAGQRRLDFSGN